MRSMCRVRKPKLDYPQVARRAPRVTQAFASSCSNSPMRACGPGPGLIVQGMHRLTDVLSKNFRLGTHSRGYIVTASFWSNQYVFPDLFYHIFNTNRLHAPTYNVINLHIKRRSLTLTSILCCKKAIHNNIKHTVCETRLQYRTEYTACQASLPVVRLGSPHPLTCKRLLVQGGRHNL
jgi:hypothetical protein